MIRSLIVVAALLVSAPVAAQRVLLSIDLSSLGWGAIDAEPINSDGDPNTQEWLVRKLDAFPAQWRVVSTSGATMCAGNWFTVPQTDPANPFVLASPTTVGGKTVLRVGGVLRFAIVSLDTPRC